MSIVLWPDDIQLGETVKCVACGQSIPLAVATAGLRDSKGRQAFACNDHFWNRAQLIKGWLNFVIRNRASSMRKGPGE